MDSVDSYLGKWMALLILLVFSIHYREIAAQGDNNPDILANMNIDPSRITLSGFSSGGTFAQMLQISYSSLFSGIAVFSHTFYRCGPANGEVQSYDRVCTTLFNVSENEYYDPELVHIDIQDYERRGLIETTWNLRNKRLYVYTGLRNAFFTPRQSLNILRVYERYINSTSSIFTRVQDGNLVLPIDRTDVGLPCTEDPVPSLNTTYFLGQCGFSGVSEAMNFLLREYNHQNQELPNERYRSTLRAFDQREFTRNINNHQMDNVGYYYVPRKCRKGSHNYNNRCLLHFYFHGCTAGREFVGTRHIENTGLLELADRRGIIVVFPQALSSSPQNIIGCWDTFGIGGQFYATQIGPQIMAVKRILDRVRGLTFPSSVAPASSTKQRDFNFVPSTNSASSINQRQFTFRPSANSPSPYRAPSWGRTGRHVEPDYIEY